MSAGSDQKPKVILRAYAFLDTVQPQFASFISTTAQGYLPTAGQSMLFVEVAPGMAINDLADKALKGTRVRPGMMIVERAFGMLEVHEDSQGEVRQAGQAILDGIGVGIGEVLKPKIVSNQVIRHVSDFQAQLINNFRRGNMLLGGQTLFIMETEPAAYAVLAANEAEKAANINIVHIQPFGAFGRVYLGGEEADIEVAKEAALRAVEGLGGKAW
ncbi:MAG: BMC domain-containing protein [Candidatus Sericytochromatia bacterium]|nr:BMC domain-containing protein [Candidatus Sericytochromatia bacterium]